MSGCDFAGRRTMKVKVLSILHMNLYMKFYQPLCVGCTKLWVWFCFWISPATICTATWLYWDDLIACIDFPLLFVKLSKGVVLFVIICSNNFSSLIFSHDWFKLPSLIDVLTNKAPNIFILVSVCTSCSSHIKGNWNWRYLEIFLIMWLFDCTEFLYMSYYDFYLPGLKD